MTDEESYIQAITLVRQAVDRDQKAPSVSREHLAVEENWSKVIEALNRVSEAGSNIPVVVETPQDTSSVKKAIIELSRAVARSARRIDLSGFNQEHSILISIKRQHDENLHSDFVAALLNPRAVGKFAFEFFSRLFDLTSAKTKVDPGNLIFQKSYRELRLDSIDPGLLGQDKGARRIDIFIRNNCAVLVIESKVFTWESESQTKDYAETTNNAYKGQNIGYLILSPGGKPGEAREFKGLSFLNLLVILSDLAKSREWPQSTKAILDLYLAELAIIFYLPEWTVVEKSIERLGGFS